MMKWSIPLYVAKKKLQNEDAGGGSASFADVNVKDRRFINGGKILTITRQIVCWKTIDQSDLKNTMSTDLNK